MTPAARVLVTVGADASREAATGPRRDYAVLAGLLEGTILDRTGIDHSFVARMIRSTIGAAPAQAWLAFRRRHDYDAIVTDGEHIGIPLALLLRFTRSKVRHVTIGHRLSARKKRSFFRLLGVHRRIDRIVLHSRQQYDVAVRDLGIESHRLSLIPYQVDTSFWSPRAVLTERLVVSAGLEHRDYATLFRAVDGLDAQVEIGAASNWSRHAFAAITPPSNVRVARFDYSSLRALYARAALVVVPLADVDNQAGVTTILEAMAMGKPVVVTQSLGQTDVVEDRRLRARGKLRPRPTSLARRLAAEARIPLEATGLYVAPGDAEGLRRAISYLLEHPDERERLGRAGRRTVEALFTVEQFAERVRALVDASLQLAGENRFEPRASYG